MSWYEGDLDYNDDGQLIDEDALDEFLASVYQDREQAYLDWLSGG